MIRAEGFLPDRQRALEERLGLRVLALGVVQRREVVQARGHIGMIPSRPLPLWCGDLTKLMHNGAMTVAHKTIRQSVSLPATVAAQVRSMAKSRRLSANRMLVELIENGMESEKRKQKEFFELAERFRAAPDSEEAKRLGDQLGRMVFGG
jgi:hypothetical protein